MRIFFSFLALLVFFNLIAQERTEIVVEQKPMSAGTRTAFTVQIPRGKLKDIESLWGKYVSRGTKSKISNVGGEWTFNGASERNISPYPINIFATILSTTEGIRLSASFSEGDSNQVFISKDSSIEEKLLAVKKYMTDFANLAKRDVVQQELNNETKGLRALENELKSMEKDFEESKKAIGQNQRTIEKNEAEIRRIEREIETKNEQITQQKNAIVTMTTLGDAKKVAEKDLRNFENEKRKLLIDKEKMGREIDKCRANIRAEERNIEKLNQTKALKQAEVDKQAQKVRDKESELNSIPFPGIKL